MRRISRRLLGFPCGRARMGSLLAGITAIAAFAMGSIAVVFMSAAPATAQSGGSPATMSSPTPGTTLSGASVSFSWSTGTNVTKYALYVGTTAGGFDLFSQNLGTSLSTTVPNLPTDGRAVYVRLWSLVQGSWQFTDWSCPALVDK